MDLNKLNNFDLEFIKNIEDIFSLNKHKIDILKLEGWGNNLI